MPLSAQPLLLARFWFRTTPLILPFETMRILVVIVAGFFILGMLLRSFASGRSRSAVLARAMSTPVVWMSLTFLVLIFFSYEQINLFGAPFWYLVAVLVLLAWLAAIAWRVLVKEPREDRRSREAQRINKYLPKKRP